MHAVARLDRDLVFLLPSSEWLAGHELKLLVHSNDTDTELYVLQCLVLHEARDCVETSQDERRTTRWTDASYACGLCRVHHADHALGSTEHPGALGCHCLGHLYSFNHSMFGSWK